MRSCCGGGPIGESVSLSLEMLASRERACGGCYDTICRLDLHLFSRHSSIGLSCTLLRTAKASTECIKAYFRLRRFRSFGIQDRRCDTQASRPALTRSRH